MTTLTPRQKEIYNLILSYEKKHGYVPNNIEIAKKLGVSNQAIQQQIAQMIKKGYLKHKQQVRTGEYSVVHSRTTQMV
jgi:predicted transcriptional regulator